MSEHGKKPQEEESGECAPLWMVTFSDMASLLMAFFVMLTTFSSFGPEESEVIRGIRDVALQPNYGIFEKPRKTSVASKSPAKSQADKGSEKPTLEENSGGGFSQKNLDDFRSKKVFLMESKTAFVANSGTLSPQGREFLSTLALFVKSMPNRIIISESGPDNNNAFGIARSMVALRYLVEQGISADYCNIGAIGISPSENFQSERMLEIFLLEEDIAK